jgi:hypothetical protein
MADLTIREVAEWMLENILPGGFNDLPQPEYVDIGGPPNLNVVRNKGTVQSRTVPMS